MLTIVNLIFILLVMLVSLFIAVHVKKINGIDFNVSNEAFLFSHNTLRRSIFSNTGTIFSLSLYCSGSFYLGFKSGHVAVMAIILSMLTSIFILFFVAKHHSNFLSKNNRKIISAYVGEKLGISTQAVFVSIVLLYSTIIISAELFLFNRFLIQTVQQAPISASIITLSCLIICYYYTTEGGFLGTLETDTFQLFLVVIWICYTAFILIFENGLPDIRNGIFTVKEITYQVTNGSLATKSIDFFLNNPFLIIVGSFLYLITLFLNNVGIWTKSFGTLKNSQMRSKSAIFSIILLSIFMLLPVLFGACFNGYQTDLADLEIFLTCIHILTSQNPFYSIIATLAFTSIIITTIDSLLLACIQAVNRLNSAFDPSFDKQIIHQQSILFSIIIIAGSISMFLNYHLTLITLIIIYNMNFFAFIIIIQSILKSDKIKRSFQKNNHWMYSFLLRVTEWKSPRSTVAFMVTIILSIGLLLVVEKYTKLAVSCAHLMPFFVFIAFLFFNALSKTGDENA